MEICVDIHKSKFYEKFVYKHTWTSGCSTIVYPISVWDNRKEIEIQLDDENYRGRTNCIKALMKRLSAKYKIKSWHIWKSDGSCPSTLNIYYE